MHDVLPMEGSQGRQALPHDSDGNPRLEPRLSWAGCHDHVVEIGPPLRRHRPLRSFEHFWGEQPRQVVAIDPFHLHQTNPPLLNKVVYVEQIVLLDLSDSGRHCSDSGHAIFVEPLAVVSLR